MWSEAMMTTSETGFGDPNPNPIYMLMLGVKWGSKISISLL